MYKVTEDESPGSDRCSGAHLVATEVSKNKGCKEKGLLMAQGR